uniref:Putative Xaa-Pro aminopeptidase 3 n=1 Tax=Rhizophora mucronata TaxID=61149 RepID=A0A2P2LWL7_RHIMU
MQLFVRNLLCRTTSFKHGIRCCTYSTRNVVDIGQPTPATHPQVLLLNTHKDIPLSVLCYWHAQ